MTPLGGLVDLIIPNGGRVDFTGEIKCKSELKDAVYINFKEKKILPFSMKIGAVILEPGKNAQSIKGLSSFNSRMTIY